ncbi:MAG: hypothetical protein ACTTKO_08025 [Candidatus Limimorpha sp.]
MRAAQEILERLEREDGLEANEYAASLMEVVNLYKEVAEKY